MILESKENIEVPGGRVGFRANWIAQSEAEDWMQRLMSETNWQQPIVTVFGKQHPVPRLVACHGERAYAYSNQVQEVSPMFSLLEGICRRVEVETGCRFNSVLLNYYRSGVDTMGWHADDEKALGETPVIASVSLGASRVFRMRHRRYTQWRFEVTLTHGSLFIMWPDTQENWLHSVPRQSACVSPRINLTFRYIHD